MTDRLATFETALGSFDAHHFSPAILSAAAAAWAARAANEHASIAAFDRFALGLLAVGAPAALVEAAHVAALDEIRHARIAYALASLYGGSSVGPGALDVSGALEDISSLESLTRATLIEGCIGETLSALEAEESAKVATEPAARAALSVIAADEARHAELAWAFVRWAIVREPQLARALRLEFDAALARVTAKAPQKCQDPDLTAFGFLEPRAGAALRRSAAARVLVPAAAALFDESR